MNDASTTKPGQENAPDSGIYMTCMEEIQHRLNAALWLVFGKDLFKVHDDFVLEAIFIQLRKVLELIAFGSLTVNKERYAAAHKQFASHWKAAKMLEELQKVNPNFYPLPVTQQIINPSPTGKVRWHYEVVKDNFLTTAEFVELYDISSKLLHSHNPFSTMNPAIEIKYDIPVWVERIRRLLRIHFIHLVDGRAWIVYVPDSDRISIHTAKPDPTVK